jgi:hypothetical protein
MSQRMAQQSEHVRATIIVAVITTTTIIIIIIVIERYCIYIVNILQSYLFQYEKS